MIRALFIVISAALAALVDAFLFQNASFSYIFWLSFIISTIVLTIQAVWKSE